MQDINERRILQEEVVRTPQGAVASVVEHRTRIDPTPAEQALGSVLRIQQVIWFVVGVIDLMIGLRLVLLAAGATMTAGFGAFLYAITTPFVAPFLPLFGEQGQALGSGAVMEWGSLIAILVYVLVGWLLTKLVALLMAPKIPPTVL